MLKLLLVEGPKDANLVVLVLVEVKSVQVTIPKLQEIVIKGLLGDADFFGCLLESDSLFNVHASPLAHFDDHLSNDPLLLSPTAQGLSGLVSSLNQSVRVLSSGLWSELKLDLVSAFLQASETFSVLLVDLDKLEVEQV